MTSSTKENIGPKPVEGSVGLQGPIGIKGPAGPIGPRGISGVEYTKVKALVKFNQSSNISTYLRTVPEGNVEVILNIGDSYDMSYIHRLDNPHLDFNEGKTRIAIIGFYFCNKTKTHKELTNFNVIMTKPMD